MNLDGDGDGWTDPYSEVPLPAEGSLFDDVMVGITVPEVGRAFYQVSQNRMITLTSDVELAEIIDGDAYFYSFVIYHRDNQTEMA